MDDVTLSPEITLDDFIENLTNRFAKGQIYSYIGEVLISINPYRLLPLYRPEYIRLYHENERSKQPAHLFGLAESAYRTMKENFLNSCLILSGESGSGKTEASKFILHYLTSIVPSFSIHEILLQSQILIESFGHSQTIRNANSSRFGKYLSLHYNDHFDLIGGGIQYYFPDKSRVITQQIGERSFHAIYQLFTDQDRENKFGLIHSPEEYFYVNQGNCWAIETIDDRKNYQNVLQALEIVGFNQEEIETIWKIIAAIIHLGNLKFDDVNDESCTTDELDWISHLLQCEQSELASALTSCSTSQAYHGRDTLSKALYERLFEWLIDRINQSLSPKDSTTRQTNILMISIVDMTGFEILQHNSFEQLCINYSNEKFQQLHIDTILRQEQDEYEYEQIEWQHIDYFDNQIICQLIEGSRNGLLAHLDEACEDDGTITDQTFLDTINREFEDHEYYSSWNINPQEKRTDANKVFLIRHFAGDVVYSIDGFLEKNRDTLSEDFKHLLSQSENPVIAKMWPEEKKNKDFITQRSLTAGSLFRTKIINLINLLRSKELYFIRCMKPNHEKSDHVFDQTLIEHQINAFGLMDMVTLRLRGFAYRSAYEQFVQRYKIINDVRSKLYPHGLLTKENAMYICQTLHIDDVITFGRTKLYIKDPKTFADLEQERMKGLETIVILLQKYVRQWRQRRLLRLERYACRIQNFYRRSRARTYFHALIQTISTDLGKIRIWPEVSSNYRDLNRLLHQIYQRWRIEQIKLHLPLDEQSTFAWKLLAGKYLKQRPSYFDRSIIQKWKGDYLQLPEDNTRPGDYEKFLVELRKRDQFDRVIFSTFAIKLNSRLKTDERAIILTEKFIYKCDPKRNYQMKKAGIPLEDITGLSLTAGKEQLIIIHLISNDDLVIYIDTKNDRVGEVVGWILKLKANSKDFFINVQRNISVSIRQSKYIIDIVWDHVNKIDYRKNSNNIISLILPDRREKH